jgi:D-alanyl-D-alanine dipeptidase
MCFAKDSRITRLHVLGLFWGMTEPPAIAGVANRARPPSLSFRGLPVDTTFCRFVASLLEHFLQDGTGTPLNSITTMFDSLSSLGEPQYPQRAAKYPLRGKLF